MTLDAEKIIVRNRIRKDYGDLEELAKDIKENGLINPPVVTPDNVLIAGERRFRAMTQILGWKQIEVRPMTVQDALHQLKLEISENENRKEFTYSERMLWAERLKEELTKVAEANSAANGFGDTSVNNFTLVGRVNDQVAKDVGLGSGRNLSKAEYIKDNADEDMIRQLDEKQLSINAAYVQLKKQAEEAKKEKDKLEASELNLRNALTVKNRMIEDAQAEADKYKERVDLLESTPIKIPDEKIRTQIDLLKQKEREQYEVAQTAIRDKAKLEEEKRKMEQQHAKDMSDLERRLNNAVEDDGDDVNALKERIKELEKQAEVREQNERQTLTILGRNRTHTELVQEAQGRLLGELSNHNLDYYIREQRENNLIADMSQAFKDLICEHGEAMIHEIVVVLKYCGWEEDIEWKVTHSPT